MKNEDKDAEWYLQEPRIRKWMVQCIACNRWGYRHDAPPKFHGRAQLEKHIGEMAPRIFSLIGYRTRADEVATQTATKIAAAMKDDGVTHALLVPV